MSAIIRCVSDVLQFQYELSNRRGAQHNDETSTPNSQLHPVLVDDEVSSEPPSRASPVDNAQPPPSSASAPVPIWWTSLKSRKRPRGSDSAQRMITMLLQPTSAHKLPPLSPSDDPEDVQERLSRIELQVLYGADQHQHHQYPLSRLQALTLQRGGADNISDDELFEPGELEGYRNAEEDALLLGASHPEWDTVAAVETKHGNGNGDAGGGGGGARGISENKEKQRGKRKRKGGVKRSKADSVPVQVSYSDSDEEEEDGDEYKGEGEGESDESMELDNDDDDDGPVQRSRRHSTQQRSRSRGNRIAGTTDTRTRTRTRAIFADGDGDGGDGDRNGNGSEGDGNGNGNGSGGDGGVDTESRFPLGKDAYLASFGIFPGWEGDDPDTVRYFGENMEEM